MNYRAGVIADRIFSEHKFCKGRGYTFLRYINHENRSNGAICIGAREGKKSNGCKNRQGGRQPYTYVAI